MSTTPEIVNPQGKPARATASDVCPQCGRGKEARITVAPFGCDPYHACVCGYEFKEGVNGG